MIKGYEIERKFLVEIPDMEKLDVKKCMKIYQTYLKNDENEYQRRVRKIEQEGTTTYTYTEKLFITSVTRREMEYNIDEKEYLRLVSQAREDCTPIEKERCCFEYMNQLFELDKYPFSESLAILEIELESPEQNIEFPDYISIIQEVTGIEGYSNASLAAAGAFPECDLSCIKERKN